ncbi:hypothetical protein HD554DRAFT_2170379 [Boletus coccyginus]|nr:hypothetical protein HD554DRAFT_2170379 [Boletus coccyginus]
MALFPLIRQGVLGATALFSLIELAISANLTSQTEQFYAVTATFTALGIAVGVISVLTLPVMLIVDIIRRGAFTSMIVVELGWLGVLWILWVATAGESISEFNYVFPLGCIYNDSTVNGMCQEVQAITAFSFLNFIILLLYTGVLSVMAVVAAARGQGVWLSSVKESFGASAGPTQHSMTQYSTAEPQKLQIAHPVGVPVGVPV